MILGDVSFRLNGRPETAAGVSPTTTLLEYLRASGRVGTKEGCGDGDCGACTVAMAGRRPDGTAGYLAVNSCLVPLGSVAGRDVVSVEGLARGGALHPVQRALADAGGSQCGYCTPGFVMSLFAGYYDGLTDDESVEGNLCRCTGYAPIRRAAASLAGPAAGDPIVAELAGAPLDASGAPVGAAGRVFHRPATLDDTLALLAAHPDAALLAGGTDYGLELSHHTTDPAVVVSLEGVTELHALDVTDGEVVIGAAVPLTHLRERLRGTLAALDGMLDLFAARQIRNRATLGGNLGTASPIGDLLPVLLALDAVVELAGPEGSRRVGVEGYFTGYRTTVRAADEVVVSVTIPRHPAPGLTRVSGSSKVGKRGTDDISIVAAAFTLDLDADDRVAQARLAYGGVAATPVRAREVEEMLVGNRLHADSVRAAVHALARAFTPLDDVRASAAYRRRLAGALFERFVDEHAPAGRPQAVGV